MVKKKRDNPKGGKSEKRRKLHAIDWHHTPLWRKRTTTTTTTEQFLGQTTIQTVRVYGDSRLNCGTKTTLCTMTTACKKVRRRIVCASVQKLFVEKNNLEKKTQKITYDCACTHNTRYVRYGIRTRSIVNARTAVNRWLIFSNGRFFSGVFAKSRTKNCQNVVVASPAMVGREESHAYENLRSCSITHIHTYCKQ